MLKCHLWSYLYTYISLFPTIYGVKFLRFFWQNTFFLSWAISFSHLKLGGKLEKSATKFWVKVGKYGCSKKRFWVPKMSQDFLQIICHEKIVKLQPRTWIFSMKNFPCIQFNSKHSSKRINFCHIL